MRISGVTILRQVVRLGYPFEESIRSLLPLVDELIVNVGQGDEGTWEAVQAIGDPRLKPFRSDWPAPRGGGDILSQQTNLALARCSGDWAVYLQADEALHEDDLDALRAAMRRHLSRRTEGLLFRYHHFWRHYDCVSDDWVAFYPRAVRAVKLHIGVESVGDACGFLLRRGGVTRGLIKADSGAYVYHYGWCNPAERQLQRFDNLRAVYGLPYLGLSPAQIFGPLSVRAFRGSHPRTMYGRIANATAESGPRTSSRWPALVRASLAVARSPWAARGWARPLFPVALTNAWWTAIDWWERRRVMS